MRASRTSASTFGCVRGAGKSRVPGQRARRATRGGCGTARQSGDYRAAATVRYRICFIIATEPTIDWPAAHFARLQEVVRPSSIPSAPIATPIPHKNSALPGRAAKRERSSSRSTLILELATAFNQGCRFFDASSGFRCSRAEREGFGLRHARCNARLRPLSRSLARQTA